MIYGTSYIIRKISYFSSVIWVRANDNTVSYNNNCSTGSLIRYELIENPG